MCFSQMPMQPLIDVLNKDWKNGRNDDSNETMVKLLIVKKLRRELLRNPTLRRLYSLVRNNHRAVQSEYSAFFHPFFSDVFECPS